MPRGQYQRKTSAAKSDGGATATPSVDDPSAADNVLHPVEGNPAACPPPLCPEDFPAGWPDGAEQSAGCSHGMWIRQWPPAAKAAESAAPTPTVTPESTGDASTDGGE